MPSQVDGNSAAFADRLRILMREQRVGNDTLSQRTGISARLIAKYRAGTTQPRDAFGDPTRNAHKLAEALSVSLTDLGLNDTDNGTEAAA